MVRKPLVKRQRQIKKPGTSIGVRLSIIPWTYIFHWVRKSGLHPREPYYPRQGMQSTQLANNLRIVSYLVGYRDHYPFRQYKYAVTQEGFAVHFFLLVKRNYNKKNATTFITDSCVYFLWIKNKITPLPNWFFPSLLLPLRQRSPQNHQQPHQFS